MDWGDTTTFNLLFEAWYPELLSCHDKSSDTTEVPQYTEEEIAQAIETQTLTAEHCMYLHEQGVNWQVNVQRAE